LACLLEAIGFSSLLSIPEEKAKLTTTLPKVKVLAKTKER